MINHKSFLNIAEEIASNSHCVQLHVGAVLVKNNRIISTGYNGTPRGFKNCDEFFENYNAQTDRAEHHDFSEKFEIHAEMNAILYAAIHGNSIENCDIYVTHHPCNNCLKMLCAAGIKNIYYRYGYDKVIMDDNLKRMLDSCNVNLIPEECCGQKSC